MIYLVNDITSLEKLSKDKNLRRSLRKIQLDLPISNSENYSKEINKRYFACGCEHGALALLITILAVMVLYFTTELPIIKYWWYVPIYLLIGAFIGKIYGIVYEKIQFNKTIKSLRKELLNRESNII